MEATAHRPSIVSRLSIRLLRQLGTLKDFNNILAIEWDLRIWRNSDDLRITPWARCS